jgi:integrase
MSPDAFCAAGIAMALNQREGSSAWQYDFTVAGKRYRGTTKQKTKARAKEVEAGLVIKALNNQLPASARKAPTFLEFATDFTDHIEKSRLMPGSVQYYKTGLATLKKKPLAQMRIDQINQRVIETTQFDGSGSHVNCALRTLRRMLGLAQAWDLLTKIPKIKLARENRRTAIFDPGEEKIALDALEQPWCDVFLVMCDCGMRNEEAVAVRWEHVDFDRDIIFNPRVKAEDTEGWVPLSQRLKNALKARHHGQKQGWVFPSKRSETGHLCPNISRPFAKMRRDSGMSAKLVPYSARHTFATAMLEMTGDVVFVGKLIGHKNPLTTARYLHPSMRKAKGLIDRRNQESEENLRHNPRHSGQNQGSSESS